MVTTALHTLEAEVHDYLVGVMTGLEAPRGEAPALAGDEVAEAIFDLVTSRRFCYLGRTKTAPYRADTLELLRRRMAMAEPFRFFYDIGPGYHASLRPEELPLRFDVGLSELLILFQIDALSRGVEELYAPGVRFWLVVDNLCGLRTNDIPLERTEAYCLRLRELIGQLQLESRVELIVESEVFRLEEYDRLLAELPLGPVETEPSPGAVENVQRFLGRRCSVGEAAERMERYRRTTTVTDSLVDSLVRDVHMTQRATGATLGFRPFPGGDSRTQSGEVVLGRNEKGRLRPFLLTSRNAADYELHRLSFPALLPPAVTHVLAAEPAG